MIQTVGTAMKALRPLSSEPLGYANGPLLLVLWRHHGLRLLVLSRYVISRSCLHLYETNTQFPHLYVGVW